MEKLLTTKEAAAYLRLSPAWLDRDRWSGPTLIYVRIASRLIRYRQSDLDAYIESRVQKVPIKNEER